MARGLLKSAVYGAVLGAAALGAAAVFGWTGPSAAPPGGNIDAPINVSATAQSKAGNLTVGSLCFSGDCRSAWTGSRVQTGAVDLCVTSCAGGQKNVAVPLTGFTSISSYSSALSRFAPASHCGTIPDFEPRVWVSTISPTSVTVSTNEWIWDGCNALIIKEASYSVVGN